MKLKLLMLLIGGALLYVLATYSVLRFYPDDPAQMNWMDREAFNARFIGRLQPDANMRQELLISRLGSPDITEAFRSEQQIYQLLYYRTHRKAADGITTADECTALLFVDRQLVAVGEAAVIQYQAAKADVSGRS
ncbi:hypothetical protein AEST_09200 [Alishewanella aestuarii B11]|uniref:DUF3192 domain-containing protein n=1 Tax=Alishewanella aestuarii B11 TaxID=1197174 RepID=J2IHD9_9ALTE|nr:DUF3192 domain-containing protein [Alishewanella aestuarii]EJI86199.1 hypothetical protein AEST_09200 [Alishewanella aestuarii B11]